jgi:hypothetical protein
MLYIGGKDGNSAEYPVYQLLGTTRKFIFSVFGVFALL